MRAKRKPTIISAFIGGILGLLYTIYSYSLGYMANTNIMVFFIANLLYFSLLGYVVGTIFELITLNKKTDLWHVGALLGFVAFLIIILFTSIRDGGFLCRNLNADYQCNANQFVSAMILEGPFPLHILQVCLILLGMLIGLLIGNRDMWRLKK